MTAWVELGEDNRVAGRCDACRWHLASVYLPDRRRPIADRVRDALLMAVAGQLHDDAYCEATPAPAEQGTLAL